MLFFFNGRYKCKWQYHVGFNTDVSMWKLHISQAAMQPQDHQIQAGWPSSVSSVSKKDFKYWFVSWITCKNFSSLLSLSFAFKIKMCEHFSLNVSLSTYVFSAPFRIKYRFEIFEIHLDISFYTASLFFFSLIAVIFQTALTGQLLVSLRSSVFT